MKAEDSHQKSEVRGQRSAVALAALLWALAAFPAPAQDYAINWWTIDCGGGTSTGGDYALSGTIGQPDAGHMSGGPFAIEGGFWGLLVGPGPSILVTLTNGVVTVYWDRPATDWLLDQTSTLNGTPIPWAQVPFPYKTNTTHIYITVPSPTGNKFYRLRKP
jgi:hypothetical protein